VNSVRESFGGREKGVERKTILLERRAENFELLTTREGTRILTQIREVESKMCEHLGL